MKYFLVIVFLGLIGCAIPVFAELESVTFDAPKNPLIDESFDAIITTHGVPNDEQDVFEVAVTIEEMETGKILYYSQEGLLPGPNEMTLFLLNFPKLEYYKEDQSYLLIVKHESDTFAFEFAPVSNKTTDNDDVPKHILPPGYAIIEGRYENEEFGFGITLPDSMRGFLTEIDNPNVGKIINIQAHPELSFNEPCCPSVDTSPAGLLLDNHPTSFLATPVPLTGDIYAAFQGYDMNMKIEKLAYMQVLTSTIEKEREYPPDYPEPIKRIGKFYFVNAGERYISYGIFASEENYAKYINEFEESAKSLTAINAIPIDLDEIFFKKNFQVELRLEDNSSIFPKITTPSTVTSLIADKSFKSLQINFTEPNEFRSFLAINIGDLLEGPYEITFDEKPMEGQILENESGKYLVVFYSGKGQHSIHISGSFVNSVDNPPYQIEKINDKLYYVSEPLALNSDPGKIIFQGVIFRPHIHEPPLQTDTFVTFADGKKEAFFVGFDEPAFSENVNPQAGFVKRTDWYHLLVSVNLEELSPRKQFNSGILFSEIKCNVNLQITQKYDGTPACVQDETVFELIKRGWTSDIIKLVQSRDVFLDPKDATSSYMDRITPTLDDFKNALSEPYDMDVIFSKFGDPHDDIGSGIHIYIYELNDSTEIWIGYVDDIWYVKHVDSNGKMLEDLFVKNKENPENCSLSFNSRCFTGSVTEIVDGNTIRINGGSVRLAFLPAPNLDEGGGTEAKKFIEVLCPVGSDVLFDQDDLQPLDRYYGGVGIMGTPLGVVYCNGLNLNEELAESEYGNISEWFCDNSEFSNREWAKKNGC